MHGNGETRLLRPRPPSKEMLQRLTKEQTEALLGLEAAYNGLIATAKEIIEAEKYARTADCGGEDFCARTAAMIICDTSEFRIADKKKKIATKLLRVKSLGMYSMPFVQDIIAIADRYP